MTDINLSQSEADALLEMEKYRISETHWDYPSFGGSVSIPLRSLNKREEFLLDISRGKIDLKKTEYQNRARHVVVLVRVDLGGPPHRNPDDTEVAAPHWHLYREGYGDKWATPLPEDVFSSPGDLWQVLQDFMRFCSIVEAPFIRRGLFT
ncbi:MAG: hypothetical protein JXL84_10470 [Deltaproteobacteria bacterium]|nr:hypothetical protein [Deltaproteobacteria bacterium]